MDDEQPIEKPIAQDHELGPGAFLERPPGSPVYYGFPILDETEVCGFRWGLITDFLAQPGNDGDAFVVAPDGERAGIVWTTTGTASVDPVPILAPDPERWGVWAVTLRYPMRSAEDARRNLAAILPDMRGHWEAWRGQFQATRSSSEDREPN